MYGVLGAWKKASIRTDHVELERVLPLLRLEGRHVVVLELLRRAVPTFGSIPSSRRRRWQKSSSGTHLLNRTSRRPKLATVSCTALMQFASLLMSIGRRRVLRRPLVFSLM